MVDATTGDDASVFRMGNTAVVYTLDFITPLVDDPFTWGRIAATNAVSDVYAMGGTPKFALNIVAWNIEVLSDSILVEVLKGAEYASQQGGWITVGGHTVTDDEPKFGLSVVGEADPDRLLRNSSLKPGDTILLSKPIGTGIITTAIKSGQIQEADAKLAIDQMATLNDLASQAALRFGSIAATDITGFGLLGHLHKMARASTVTVEIDLNSVPVLPGVRELIRQGQIPGGTRRNLAWVRPSLRVLDEVAHRADCEEELLLLADAQTSGGLCFAVRSDQVEPAIQWLSQHSIPTSPIGKVIEQVPGVTLSIGP